MGGSWELTGTDGNRELEKRPPNALDQLIVAVNLGDGRRLRDAAEMVRAQFGAVLDSEPERVCAALELRNGWEREAFKRMVAA